ncbi:uncharacterized protein LOC108096511 [Drosophila ficusphila]|uniref:uncharacterized protein LOC108096511 n=1 Tax=Drosophila ficusphila TaxID=30025 RepID=UPI001C893E99|nr:uncharacterized protein LOC108096511 [Drosophila ficusphila]
MEKESEANNSTPDFLTKQLETPVLNISGTKKTKTIGIRGKKAQLPPVTPIIPEPPKINTTSFPVIVGRILLKSNDTPKAFPKDNPSDFQQMLCVLCLEKPDLRKRVYHMFVSNEKECEDDFTKIRKIYENRKDIKIVDKITINALCARSFYHRVQNQLTDVKWNKQRYIFETAKVKDSDIWIISHKLYEIQKGEIEQLFNYMKFLSVTDS